MLQASWTRSGAEGDEPVGHELEWAFDAGGHAQHPLDPRWSGVRGTIVDDRLPPEKDGRVHRRTVTACARNVLYSVA